MGRARAAPLPLGLQMPCSSAKGTSGELSCSSHPYRAPELLTSGCTGSMFLTPSLKTGGQTGGRQARQGPSLSQILKQARLPVCTTETTQHLHCEDPLGCWGEGPGTGEAPSKHRPRHLHSRVCLHVWAQHEHLPGDGPSQPFSPDPSRQSQAAGVCAPRARLQEPGRLQPSPSRQGPRCGRDPVVVPAAP